MLTMQAAGYIGKTAETRSTQGGESATSWSLAIKTGKDKTAWLQCTMWGDRGEKLAPYLTKGAFVVVNGFPSARAWVDKNSGDARAELGMSVSQVTFGSKQQDGGDSSDYRRESGAGTSAGAYDDGDAIPFQAEWR